MNLTSRLCLMTTVLGLGVNDVFAQDATITGVIKNQAGEPLIGVNVIEKGTTNGSITDINGRFSVTTSKKNPILVFSYIGFKSQEIPVNGQKNINVILREDSEELEEV